MPTSINKSTTDLHELQRHTRKVLARSRETIRVLREALERTRALLQQKTEELDRKKASGR